jgi:hypothetical protein
MPQILTPILLRALLEVFRGPGVDVDGSVVHMAETETTLVPYRSGPSRKLEPSARKIFASSSLSL